MPHVLNLVKLSLVALILLAMMFKTGSVHHVRSPPDFQISAVTKASTEMSAPCVFINATWKDPNSLNKVRPPPLLLSLPGSGNSMMRIAFEQITGFVSGALEVNDTQYQSQFKGENFCGLRQSVIKGHPQDFMPYAWRGLGKGFADPYQKPIRFNNRYIRDKCARGVVHNFKHIIYIIRNPADSMWSQYQLLQTSNHVGRILKSNFNADSWNNFVNLTATDWGHQWRSFIKPMILNTSSDRIRVLKYEELIIPEKSAPLLYEVAKNLMAIEDITMERVKCALTITRSDSSVKRPAILGDYVSSGHAFYHGLRPEVVCLAIRELGDLMQFGNYSLGLVPTPKSNDDIPVRPSSCAS